MSYQPYVTSGGNNNNNQQQQGNNQNRYPPTSYGNSGGGGGGGYAPTPAYAPAPAAGGYHPSSAPTPVYAPAPAGGYGGTTTMNYSNNPSANRTNVYAPAPAGGYGGIPLNYSNNNPTPSVYTPAPAGGYNTPAPSSYPPSGTGSNAVPDFSQALDVPPPTINPSPAPGGYGAPPAVQNRNSITYSSGYPPSTAPPMTYSPAVPIPVSNPVGGGGGYSTGGYSSGGGGGGDANYGGGGGSAVPTAVAITSSNYTGGPTGGLITEGNPSICHKVSYEIKGHEMQLVEIELDPSETIIAEAGALMFLEDGIDFETKFGDGSSPQDGFFKKLANAGGRILTGESLFITHFTNRGGSKARVGFAAPFPGTLIPMNLQNLGGRIICEKDAFLCAALGTKLSIHLNRRLGSGLVGGEGFILQKLEGDGMVFIHAGGTVIKRELRGERLRIDTGCVVAFTDGINFDIQAVPGLKSMFFGGEGMFLATLQGTGTVWIQSLPFSRLATRVIQAAGIGQGGR